MRKVELLPTQDCDAGYAPENKGVYYPGETRGF